MPRALLSCENKQELKDLTAIARELQQSHGHEFYYFNITTLLNGGLHDQTGTDSFKQTWNSKAIKGRPFKKMPSWLKLGVSLLNAAYLAFLFYRKRLDFILIGTPLLTYRLTRALTFGNIKIISYIRGIIAYSDEKTSISSRIFIKSRKFTSNSFISSFFSDYYADIVICTGEVSARFIESRGVPHQNINIVGSVYCDMLDAKNTHEGKKTIIFVSSAFAFHGYSDAQDAQIELIKDIKNHISKNHQDAQFIIRLHPREAPSHYEGDLLEFIDQSQGDPLTNYPSNSLFLSPISTLIFEMAYAGRQSRIICNRFFSERFDSWYNAMQIQPDYNWKGLIDDYISRGSVSPQASENAIATEHRGHVVRSIASLITAGNPR